MSRNKMLLTIKRGKASRVIEGTRVVFAAKKCFAYDNGPDDINCLQALGNFLKKQPSLGILGDTRLLGYLLQHVDGLQSTIQCVISDNPSTDALGFPLYQQIPASIETIFLTETHTVPRQQIGNRLPAHIKAIDLDILCGIALDMIPQRAWAPISKTIYPIQLPEIKFEKDLDMLLLDCPARNLALMPNGIGYVHNALKKTSITFQTFDLDLVAYHRYHINRLFDEGGKIILKSGKELPEDPWQAEHYDLWSDQEVIDHFSPIIEETTRALLAARPKILGLSIHGCNEIFSRNLANAVKAALPETIILAGGYSCYNADIGLRAFPECDYMCISESDLTVGPLVEALASGDRPANQPGILSRYDSKDHHFIPGPVIHNIDNIEFPKYEWFDLNLYRNFNGYQLTPIIASRGCRWSRCTFCAERFYWRIRTKENFVEELEWLIDQGCTLFMFNESDLNGMPEKLLEICDEIQKKALGVKLTGQLRMHKKSDRAFFDKLRAAGFVALRFGIDAFSENTLRLQKKGYTTETISQNLKDCWEAGIYTEINWVIGVPGETDDDIREGIDLILKNQKYIGRLSNINPLILINGSVYWTDPQAHNIHFREPLEQILEKNPRAIPADLWYSTNPYIDASVRKKRFELIVRTLHENGFPVGAWAARVIDDVQSSRDKVRAGGTKPSESHIKPAEAVAESDINSIPIKAPPGQTAKPRVIRFADAFYMTSEQSIDDAFNKKAQDEIKKQRPQAIASNATSIPPRTPVRRLIALMPESFKSELKRILRIELYNRRGDAGGRSDKLYAFLILRGIFKEYVMKSISHILGLSPQRQGLHEEKISGTDYSVTHAVTKGAEPELIRTIANYNIVLFDGAYYGLPHGLSVDWERSGIASIPGVLFGRSAREVTEQVLSVTGNPARLPRTAREIREDSKEIAAKPLNTPQLLVSIESYNIFSYEGWFYGIPHSAGPLNLAEIDVMDMPGIIRDVSRDVVESEIMEQARMPGSAIKK